MTPKQKDNGRQFTSKYDKLRKKIETRNQIKKPGNNKILPVFIIGILILSSLMFMGAFNGPSTGTKDNNPTQSWNSYEVTSEADILIFSSPDCSCCHEYVSYMEDLGYNVDFRKSDSMTELKDELDIPDASRSCHTSKIGGYFVEGHVPIEAINKLLNDQPAIDGISLPGMPGGSPGMPGEKAVTFTIQSIVDGEVSGTFMEI